MERLAFGEDTAFAPRDDRLEHVTVAPLTGSILTGAPFQAAVFRLAAGGRIARHHADVAQILAVLQGEAEVSGADGVLEPLVAGQAVYWPQGEEHETRSAAGVVALILEGDGLEPFRR